MSNNLDIQQLDASHCLQLAVLDQKLRYEEGDAEERSLVQLEIQMKSWITNDFHAIGLLDDGLVVAFCLYRAGEGSVFVKKLFVEDEHRQKGIATALIDHVQAQYEGASLRLNVAPENEPALAFYESLGFRVQFLSMERSGH